ncbi:hypothetical protein CASFOL_036083 [Castilleja foliolosa]|uniref:Alpha/beta hydrolase fold-3 domain-containing protein n=1 Tax=Castilleja foliolosa TaxID=1961234 RepID=A0ABD3BUK1_9LAMI
MINTMFLHIFLLVIIFSQYLFSITIATNSSTTNSSTISYQVLPFIRVYTNGTVERLRGTKIVPPSLDPETRVLSIDIQISTNPNISARIYRPDNATWNKLPLLVYFHGGAFFTESAFSPTYHNFTNSLVANSNVIAVSVNYRLAPENLLPIGYQDSWRALKWIFSHNNNNNNKSDEAIMWLKKYVNFSKVYVAGDSAGGNIAHNMAMRAGLDKTGRVVLNGMFLNCPHFWGVKRIGNESIFPESDRAGVEGIWVHAYPNSKGSDDPLMNPRKDPNINKLGCKNVLVYVAELDIYKDRGLDYGKMLNESKWGGDVRVVEVKGEYHVFNLNNPDSPKAKDMLQDLAKFLNQG